MVSSSGSLPHDTEPFHMLEPILWFAGFCIVIGLIAALDKVGD